MKSELFSKFDLHNPDNYPFFEDLTDTFALSEETILKIVSKLSQYIQSRSSGLKRKLAESISEELKLQSTQILNSMDVLYFLFAQPKNHEIEKDTPEIWASDLLNAGFLTQDNKDLFIKIIKEMNSTFYQELNRERLLLISRKGIFPSIRRFDTTVELRAVIEKEYHWEEKVSDFNPNIIGLVPIISCSLSTDVEENCHYYFQVDTEEALFIINQLQSALKIAKTLQEK